MPNGEDIFKIVGIVIAAIGIALLFKFVIIPAFIFGL